MLIGWSIIDLKGFEYLVSVLEDRVFSGGIEELADLLELLVKLGNLPCLAGFIFLDSLRSWFDFGYKANN